MIINGEKMSFENQSISKLLKHLKLEPEHIVFELNGEIISRNQYSETELCSDSKIEIIAFVGGG